MGVLASDEDDLKPRMHGKLLILPDNWNPTARQISQTALVKYETRKENERAAEAAKPVYPAAQISTRALCEKCLEHPRCGASTFCAGCIRAKAFQSRRSFLDRELTAPDFLILSLMLGFLVFALVKIASTENRGAFEQKFPSTRQPR